MKIFVPLSFKMPSSGVQEKCNGSLWKLLAKSTVAMLLSHCKNHTRARKHSQAQNKELCFICYNSHCSIDEESD